MCSADSLPPYLLNDVPMEVEQLPLQVALLTGELAMQRRALNALAGLLSQAAGAMELPGDDL
jgi:hypothetical protein